MIAKSKPSLETNMMRCRRTKKVCYPTKKDAQSILNLTISKRGGDGAKRLYYCDFCNSYHLTSMEFPEKTVGTDNFEFNLNRWESLLQKQEDEL